MSQQNDGPVKGFTATSAVTRFRRVKLTTSSGTAVEHAGAGEAYIGVSQDDVAIGLQVPVRLTGRGKTTKVTAAGAFSAGATLYGAAAGKVDDTVSGSAIGTALEAATADGDVVEMAEDNGYAASVGEQAPANVADGAGGIPIVYRKKMCTAGTCTIVTLGRKVRVIDVHFVCTNNTGGNLDIYNGSSCSILGAVVAHGTTDTAIVRGAKIDDAKHELASGCVLSLVQACASGTIVYVTCLPVA